MKNLGKKKKIIIAASAGLIFAAAFMVYTYVTLLPAVISSNCVNKFITGNAKKALGIDVRIENPILKTSFSPYINFSVDEINIDKNDTNIFNIKKLDANISLAKLFAQKIVVNKLGADYIFADVNKLISLCNTPGNETQKSIWQPDFFESLLYIKKCFIVYKASAGTDIKLDASNIEITSSRNPKFVRFNVILDIIKNKEKLSFKIADNDNVYIDKRKLYIKDCALNINKSKILINSVSDDKNNYDLTVVSKAFDVKNIVELIGTNFIINNGEEILSYFKDINGDFDLDAHLTNNITSARVKFNRGNAAIVPLNNLKISLQSGEISVDKNEILLKNFKGVYNNKASNPVKLEGVIKDYMKSFDTEITIDTVATKEFSTKHLSKIIGYPVEIVGKAPTRIVYKQLYDKMNIIIMSKLAKGDDILVDGASLSPTGWDRAVKADLYLENSNLNIKSVDYYIAQDINKNSKIKPILTIFGNVECTKGIVKNLGFYIPKPLPSEFLNVLAGQKLFKKGTVSGYLQIVNTGKYPVLDGNLAAQKVRIPSQRLFIKDAHFTTANNLINLSAQGKYKRSDYNFKGGILNEIKFPIVIKDVNLTVDNIDIDRILNSFNSQNSAPVNDAPLNTDAMLVNADKNASEDDMDAVTFNTGVLIVEKCALNVVKGVYKEIKFGNLKADLTLDKNGVLDVKSNKFDIAEGISSCKVHCDLMNHKYSLVLGVKDINSDIMATSLLNLKKEISGKASGIISLNTDDSLKLNGGMKFIVKNGTIGKIGLIEYVLKFAALFRNPMAMMSPSTFVDLVNIPEGNFDKITGDLDIKNNVIEKIVIKSSAPQLSSLIAGRFDLETRDATLRIYTKFSNKNKGFSGALRNLSLNSLANRVPLNSRSDANYYSAELQFLPPIDADERDCQVFLTKVDGDVEHNNFISSLKKIK